jgi:uncharacterized metal-binding protein
MTKPQIKIVNCETGEEIIRDANANEIAQFELDNLEIVKRQAEAEAKAVQKQALLDKLGITADEAKLLLG